MKDNNKVTTPAKTKYPSPQLSPTAIARKTKEISFESPGALRNLTKVKAPAIENALATLLPINKITTDTIAGRIIKLKRKLLERSISFVMKLYAIQIIRPNATANSMQRIAAPSFIASTVSKLLKILSNMIYPPSYTVFILRPIFRKTSGINFIL